MSPQQMLEVWSVIPAIVSVIFVVYLNGRIIYSDSDIESERLDFELVEESCQTWVDRRQRRDHEDRILHCERFTLDH